MDPPRRGQLVGLTCNPESAQKQLEFRIQEKSVWAGAGDLPAPVVSCVTGERSNHPRIPATQIGAPEMLEND